MATIIEMPKLSDTMTVGTLVNWLKKEGDAVEPGDMIAEVETDKATMELENFEEGVILKQYVKEGTEVPVGAPVCAVGEKGEEAPPAPGGSGDSKAAEDEKPAEPAAKKEEGKAPEPKVEDKGPSKSADQSSEDALKQAETASAEPSTEEGSDSRIKASPLAKKLASEKGVDLSQVKGTGPGGRIVKDDVLQAAENPPASKPSPKVEATAAPSLPPSTAVGLGGEDKTIKVSNMRGTIARRLLESKTTVPHFYLEMEIDVGPLLALRKTVNEGLAELSPEQGGMKLTVNDFIMKASIEALRRVPAANSSWQGDKIIQYGNVHLAFAVAVEEGLLTPTVKNADTKGIRQLAVEAKELIGKARSRKLKPDEMSGSTFTISNLGMFGIRNFYGIINPPNGAILCVGATEKKPVVDKNDNIVVGHRMALGLACDHRVVDGAIGAQFLAELRKILEKPALMLV